MSAMTIQSAPSTDCQNQSDQMRPRMPNLALAASDHSPPSERAHRLTRPKMEAKTDESSGVMPAGDVRGREGKGA
eukprot:scaffold11025_cov41-Phaeocystis_antarctica.AAC.1